ncbi:MAG: hypothetical protein R3E66_18585 [bacterium]
MIFRLFIVLLVAASWGCKKTEPAKPHVDGLAVWPGGDPIRVHPTQGTMPLDPQHVLALTPATEGATWTDWSLTTGEAATEMRRTGALRGMQTTARWVFSNGNPQLVFEWSTPTLPHDAAGEEILLSFELPAGDVRYVDAQQRVVPFVGKDVVIPPAAPRWLEWRGAQRTLVFSQWTADQMRITPVESGVRLDLVVWDPAMHVEADCVPEPGPGLKASMMLTVGEEPAIFAARLADGRQSAIVPIFVDGGTSAIAQEGASLNAADYARRVRTLALGHSDSEDPRHGNGGLVGASLGGTFLASAEQLAADEVGAVSQALAGTTVDLAVDNQSTTARIQCETMEGRKTLVDLRAGAAWEGNYHNDVASVPPVDGGWPTVWTTPVLDGSREAVTDQILSKPYLDQARRDRAVIVFQTPLVATRNPLVDAFNHSLIVPERQGQWTIAPEFERRLADLELDQEVSWHAVLSADALMGQIRSSQAMKIVREADGSWTVNGKMSGLTLVIPGQHAVSINGTPAQAQDVGDSQPQTWVVLDVDGSAKVEVAEAQKLEPIQWVFQP